MQPRSLEGPGGRWRGSTGLRPRSAKTEKGPGTVYRVVSGLAPLSDFTPRGGRGRVKAVPPHLVPDLYWKWHTWAPKCLQGTLPASAVKWWVRFRKPEEKKEVGWEEGGGGIGRTLEMEWKRRPCPSSGKLGRWGSLYIVRALFYESLSQEYVWCSDGRYLSRYDLCSKKVGIDESPYSEWSLWWSMLTIWQT